MTTTRKDAERLLKIRAEYGHWTDYDQDEAAATLRKLAAENEALRADVAQAESAVIKRLAAGASVEPVAFTVGRQTHGGDIGKYLEWNREATPKSVGEEAEPLYTATALAAARVQENERCEKAVQKAIGDSSLGIAAQDAIRALLGKEAQS